MDLSGVKSSMEYNRRSQAEWVLPSEPVVNSSPEIQDWIAKGKDLKNNGNVFVIKNIAIFGDSIMDCCGAVTFGRRMRENTQAVINRVDESRADDFNESMGLDLNDFFDVDGWGSEVSSLDPLNCVDEDCGVSLENRKVQIFEGEVSECTNSKEETELKFSVPIIDGADAVLLRGAVDKYEKEFFDKVKRFIDGVNGKCLIFICVDGLSDNCIKRLEFENDAVLLAINGMGMPYYEASLAEVCKENQVELDESVSPEDLILGLRRYRGENFGVRDIRTALEKAMHMASFDSRSELRREDFKFMEEEMRDICEEWQDIVGLERPKELVSRFITSTVYNLRRYGVNGLGKHKSLAFAGNPGVGKSEVIKRMSKICARKGVTNGKIVFANKSSIVGKCVGHTAGKVKKLFDDARGGILVFDEAGCLLVEDTFTKEALTEITRYMELYPDVMCIFASYKDSITSLLEAEPGLCSRISRVVEFEDYSEDELYEILEKMLKRDGYELEASREPFYRYVSLQKQKSENNWGNARLSRNVCVKIQEIVAVDASSTGINPADVRSVTEEQVERAVEELIEDSIKEDCHGKIGFAFEDRLEE